MENKDFNKCVTAIAVIVVVVTIVFIFFATSNSSKSEIKSGGRVSTIATSSQSTIGSTVANGTNGSVLFIDGSGNLGQSNSNFYWDNTNKRLGIGTTTPPSQFTVLKAPPGNGTTATTTTDFGDTSTTTSAACFNVKNSAGASVQLYVNGTTLVIASGRCS